MERRGNKMKQKRSKTRGEIWVWFAGGWSLNLTREQTTLRVIAYDVPIVWAVLPEHDGNLYDNSLPHIVKHIIVSFTLYEILVNNTCFFCCSLLSEDAHNQGNAWKINGTSYFLFPFFGKIHQSVAFSYLSRGTD